MSFGWYVVRRLVLVVPTLFGVSLISFLLTVMLPGNPAMVKAGPFATPEYRIYSRPDSVDRSGLHPERMTGIPANAALNASSAVRPCSVPVAITLAAAA